MKLLFHLIFLVLIIHFTHVLVQTLDLWTKKFIKLLKTNSLYTSSDRNITRNFKNKIKLRRKRKENILNISCTKDYDHNNKKKKNSLILIWMRSNQEAIDFANGISLSCDANDMSFTEPRPIPRPSPCCSSRAPALCLLSLSSDKSTALLPFLLDTDLDEALSVLLPPPALPPNLWLDAPTLASISPQTILNPVTRDMHLYIHVRIQKHHGIHTNIIPTYINKVVSADAGRVRYATRNPPPIATEAKRKPETSHTNLLPASGSATGI